jgi:adenylate kinase
LRKVIMVTGTPGTGKTTFGRALASSIGAEYIHLTKYISKNKLFNAIDQERQSKIVDIRRTRESLQLKLASAQGLAVIDTHIPDGVVPKGMVKQVIVLRCHPRILEARLRAKKWSPNKVRENVLSEILDSCLTTAIQYYGRTRIMQLDTSTASIKRNLAIAKKAALGKPARTETKIDWIAKLERERALDRYLKG